jgi:hypothetical protein
MLRIIIIIRLQVKLDKSRLVELLNDNDNIGKTLTYYCIIVLL